MNICHNVVYVKALKFPHLYNWCKRFHEIFGLARVFHASEWFIGKAFKGAAVVNLPQTFDNTANGQLRDRPKAEIFYTCH